MSEYARLVNHEKMCHQFFDEIHAGKMLYISIDFPLSKNESIESQQEQSLNASISILTESMLNYDSDVLRAENMDNLRCNYRPYFASFVATVDEAMAKKLETYNGWFLAHMETARSNVNDNELILEGQLITSASPVNVWDGKNLVVKRSKVSKKVVDRINSVYKRNMPNGFASTHLGKIEEELNKIWEKDSPEIIDIYNVGHGNADYIRGSKKRILYDVGFNYRSSPNNPRFPRATKAIRHLKPSCVILSHWDLDHILGCAYAEQDIFSVKWIAPNLTSSTDHNPTINAARLALFLQALGNLYLVDRCHAKKQIAAIDCQHGQKINLWLGGGKDKYVTSLRNCEGILVEICNIMPQKTYTLLAGDVPYSCMPQNLKRKINFMHVPHHCSRMELSNLRNLITKGNAAIISTNRKKDGKNNHDGKHHSELMRKFESVILTINPPSGIEEEKLAIRINLQNCKWNWR